MASSASESNEEFKLSTGRPFFCAFCGNLKFYHNYDSYKCHIRRHDKVFRKPVYRRLAQRQRRFRTVSHTNSTSLNTRNLNIDYILSDEFTDVDVYALMNEILSNCNPQPYKCIKCDKTFIDKRSLKRHEKNKRLCYKRVSCALCAKTFRSKQSLETHQSEEHSGPKPICILCNKTFVDGLSLQRHKQKEHSDSPICCALCNKRFKYHGSLERHQKLEHSSRELMKEVNKRVCLICEKSFATRGSLWRHKKQKHNGCEMESSNEPICCSLCNKTFTYRGYLERHLKVDHSTTELLNVNSFVCLLCEKSFTTKSSLQRHEQTMHNGDEPIVCSLCDKTFKSKDHLQRHAKELHSGSKPVCVHCNETFQTFGKLRYHKTTSVCKKSANPFRCGTCRADFMTKGSLLRHEKQHDNYKQYKCQHCEKMFSHKKYFEAHEKLHESGERPYKCSMCTSSFIIPNHLTQHEKLHTSGRLYQCDQCPSAFHTNARLRRHIKGHLNYKKFQCQHCQRAFSDLKYLAAHEKLHRIGEIDEVKEVTVSPRNTKEKIQDFKCRHCEKIFHSKQYLDAHEISHSGERPYKCELCGRSYIIRSHLTEHIKLHTNEKRFVCDTCGKAFPTNARLKRHKKTHAEGGSHPSGSGQPGESSHKLFTCETCGKKFPTNARLKRHYKSHTAGEETRNYLEEYQNGYKCKCGDSYDSHVSFIIHARRAHPSSTDPPINVCTQCNCPFRHKSKLHLHIKKIHGLYPCETCTEAFKMARDLTEHECEKQGCNSNEKMTKCPQCDEVIQDGQLGEHLRESHGNQKPYVCAICGDGYWGKAVIKTHIKEAHPEENGKAIIKCKIGNLASKPSSKALLSGKDLSSNPTSSSGTDNETTGGETKRGASATGRLDDDVPKDKEIDNEGNEDGDSGDGFVHFTPLLDTATISNHNSVDTLLEGLNRMIGDASTVHSSEALEQVLKDPKSSQMALGEEGSDAVRKCLDNLGDQQVIAEEMSDEQGHYGCGLCGMSFMHKKSWLLHEKLHHDDDDEEEFA